MKTRVVLFLTSIAALIILVRYGGAGQLPSSTIAASARPAMQIAGDWQHRFRLSSTTFENDGEVPQSMVYNGVLGNTCTGENRSPELSWTSGRFGTKTYAVIVFDVTASFTHWGIYNIPHDVTSLPENAGIPGSKYDQITNDAGNIGYSGPCPPPGLVHHYIFTVYALDADLHLPSSTQFPANAETLFRALIGHVLESASITGLYSTM